jgi:hypothetical protein
MSKVEKSLLFGTFEEANTAVVEDESAGIYELTQLAVLAGLDEKTAYQLVSTCAAVTKRQVFKEVKKHTETLLYFVERV